MLTNSGTVRMNGGATQVTAFTQTTGRTTVANGATLRAGSGTGAVKVIAGTLTGNGAVAGTVSGTRTVEPGRAAASPLSVGGSYSPGGGSTLDITIGGTTVGDGYGQLAVGGTAKLTNATLDLFVDPGASLPTDSSFTIVTAGSITGTFAAINGLNFGRQHFVLTYGTHDVTATVADNT